MAHGGPRWGNGPPVGHCALSAMGRIGPKIGPWARRLGLLSDNRRWMRSLYVVIMDIFPIFYIMICAIQKITETIKVARAGNRAAAEIKGTCRNR